MPRNTPKPEPAEKQRLARLGATRLHRIADLLRRADDSECNAMAAELEAQARILQALPARGRPRRTAYVAQGRDWTQMGDGPTIAGLLGITVGSLHVMLSKSQGRWTTIRHDENGEPETVTVTRQALGKLTKSPQAEPS